MIANAMQRKQDSLSAVLSRIFMAGGWNRIKDGKGFEVPPVLIWPLPAYEFSSRILGIPSESLVKLKLTLPDQTEGHHFGILPNQSNLGLAITNADRRTELLEALRSGLSYRRGGCWHLVLGEGGESIPGADLQRLQVWAYLTAASMAWAGFREVLESGAPLLMDPNGRERQTITPTGGSKGRTVAERWTEMARAKPMDRGMGLLHAFGLDPTTPTQSGLASIINADAPNDAKGASSKYRISLSPVGVALAMGLRARLNRHAKARIDADQPAAQVLSSIQSMSDPAKRLALHLLATPFPAGRSADAFLHLRDPWLCGSILGAASTRMTSNNRKDIDARLRKASLEVVDCMVDAAVMPLLETVTKPFRPVRFPVPGTSEDAKNTPPPQAPNEPTTEGAPCEMPRSGNHTRQAEVALSTATEFHRKDTDPHPKPDGVIPFSLRVHTLAVTALSIILRLVPRFRILGIPGIEGPTTASPILRLPSAPEACGREIHTLEKKAAAAGANGKLNQRIGVIYAPVPPTGPQPENDPYLLPVGSMRQPADFELVGLDAYLAENPEIMARIGREALLTAMSYRPAHESGLVTLDQLAQAITAFSPNLTGKHIHWLIRLIDTCPDDVISHKAWHLTLVLGDPRMGNAWLLWYKNATRLIDWSSFQGLDPYRMAVGAAWRDWAPEWGRDHEPAARAIADWWMAAYLKPPSGTAIAKNAELDLLRAIYRTLESVMPGHLCGGFYRAWKGLDDGKMPHDQRVKQFWAGLNLGNRAVLPSPRKPT